MKENHVIHNTKMTLFKKRGLNENGCGRTDLTKMKFDMHTTKTQKRERVGADIYHEGSGRRTPQ
jgi:hypothetical protein